jgi:hypothetical protein
MTELTNPLPALDDATDAALRESIGKYGVLVPILRDQNGDIFDGHHRHRIGTDLGVACPEERINAPLDPDERAELLAELNDARRQRLTREQRRDMVMRLREAGLSERGIAEQLDVSPATVHRDLNHPGASQEAPGESAAPNGDRAVSPSPVVPAAVTGLDGKRYSVRRPTKAAGTKPAEDKPPQQWGWRRLLGKCAKGLPFALRSRPPEVAEALEIRGLLLKLLAELDRHLRDRGVSVEPTAYVNEPGAMIVENCQASGRLQTQQSLDLESAPANGNGHEHAALAHLRRSLEALSDARDMTRPLIEDCQDRLDAVHRELHRLRDWDEAER